MSSIGIIKVKRKISFDDPDTYGGKKGFYGKYLSRRTLISAGLIESRRNLLRNKLYLTVLGEVITEYRTALQRYPIMLDNEGGAANEKRHLDESEKTFGSVKLNEQREFVRDET